MRVVKNYLLPDAGIDVQIPGAKTFKSFGWHENQTD